jgi:hypothetical protein
VNGRLQYRAPELTPPALATPEAVITPSANKTPSLELGRDAHNVMLWGIASIVLGWTLIVPLATLGGYLDVCKTSKNEQVPIPSKATVGLVLAILFGCVQGAITIARLAKHPEG